VAHCADTSDPSHYPFPQNLVTIHMTH